MKLNESFYNYSVEQVEAAIISIFDEKQISHGITLMILVINQKYDDAMANRITKLLKSKHASTYQKLINALRDNQTYCDPAASIQFLLSRLASQNIVRLRSSSGSLKHKHDSEDIDEMSFHSEDENNNNDQTSVFTQCMKLVKRKFKTQLCSCLTLFPARNNENSPPDNHPPIALRRQTK